VLLALSAVHKATPLRAYQLKRILDAREADVLSSQPPLTLGDLEQYAESTASQLLYLQLATAGGCCRNVHIQRGFVEVDWDVALSQCHGSPHRMIPQIMRTCRQAV
jgi:hypothetical protein